MKKILVAGFLALSALIGAPAIAGPIVLNGPAASNVDTSFPTHISFSTALTDTISDLNISIDLDASCCGYDNTVTLTHVDSGTSAVLWYDGIVAPGGNGGGGVSFGDVLGVVFDDEAATAFSSIPTGSFPVPAGSYQAYNSLSAFDGLSLFGTWRLTIQNTGCCAFEGDDLLAWSLIVETGTVPEPTILSLLAMGLLGMGIKRRQRVGA